MAGVAAIIAQMESQTQAPMLTISITSGFPGFQRSMTFQEGVWFGHDLTHHFTDDRAAISYSLPSGGVHQTRSLQIPSCPPPPPPVPASQSAARAGEPPGSQARPPAPAPPDMTNRPLAEQAVISALQAVAIDPHYSDFMTSMERCWPELRQITLSTVTIQNTSALTAPSALTVPHVNPCLNNRDIPAQSLWNAVAHPHAPHLLTRGEESVVLLPEKGMIVHRQGQAQVQYRQWLFATASRVNHHRIRESPTKKPRQHP